MRIEIENIAQVNHASVVIDGITVIAGENNTGKSTIGKTLYCFFNSFYDIEERLSRELKQKIETQIKRFLRNSADLTISSTMRLTEEITDRFIEFLETHERPIDGAEIKEALFSAELSKVLDGSRNEFVQIDFFENADISSIQLLIESLQEILSLPDEELFATALTRTFRREFNRQINNIYTDLPAKATLHIKEDISSITILDDEIREVQGTFSLHTAALYIDDPFVLDEAVLFPVRMMGRSGVDQQNHRTHLESLLRGAHEEPTIFDEVLDRRKIERIERKLDSVSPGELISRGSRDVAYRRPGSDKLLDARNLSSGLKTFAIIKELLLNGALEEDGTIILDEPEIHLHPEWQLIFAEIIVLLQKEYNMHILLNTHSPYFLNALQVYAAKHAIADRCNYYLAENEENGSVLSDVTHKIEKIYKRLARPLQDLENEAHSDAW